MEEEIKKPPSNVVYDEAIDPNNKNQISRSNSLLEFMDPNSFNKGTNSKNIHKPLKGRRINMKYKLRKILSRMWM